MQPPRARAPPAGPEPWETCRDQGHLLAEPVTAGAHSHFEGQDAVPTQLIASAILGTLSLDLQRWGEEGTDDGYVQSWNTTHRNSAA